MSSSTTAPVNRLKITFVTNICPHYRVRTFETISQYYDTKFYFFSAGEEWYWQQQHGIRQGNFVCEYLRGIIVLGTRIVPRLFPKLLRENPDVYIKCINGRFALPLTYAAARLQRKPFVLWTGIWMRLDSTFHRLVYPLTKYIYKHADAVVTYGVHVKKFLVSEGVPEERIFVAQHAVDNCIYGRAVSEQEVSTLREALRIGTDEKVVLYLGRLEANKGVRHLVDAFQALSARNAVLVIAGEGSERASLREQVRNLEIEKKVRFVDYVSPEDTPPYYALATVFVLPSITTSVSKELWGLVVNEAMNQGCPVVVTDAVGAAAGGLVQDRKNGLIVPEADVRSTALAIDEILDNPALRHDLSLCAKETMRNWDNERMVNGFRQAIEYVLRQPL